MKIEPGTKMWCSSLHRDVKVPGENFYSRPLPPGAWTVKDSDGINHIVDSDSLYDIPPGFAPQEGNPWRKFAHNRDDSPGEVTFGFSRFVVGKDIDGEKYPVIFDTQKAKWLTPVYPRTGTGEFWEEVQIVKWREL